MAEEGDLSDYDIHRIMEALSSRQSKVVASCALSIKILLTEIQQQLLDLMVEGRLADTPISRSNEEEDDPEEVEANEDSMPDDDKDYPATFSVPDIAIVPNESDDQVVRTGAVMPITGSLMKVPQPLPCEMCTMVFSTKKALGRHMATEHDVEDNAIDKQDSLDISAEVKKEDNANPPNINLILSKNVSSNSTKPSYSVLKVQCEVCGTQTLKQHMPRHMFTHTGIKPFTCSSCSAAFSRKDKLKDHMKKHGEKTDSSSRTTKRAGKSKVSKCRRCDFETENKKLFKEHRKTHPTKMVYKCEDCDKEFQCPSHLVQHSIKHRNEKPFMCDMCGVSFSREPNLARHIRSHTNPAPFHCKFCNKPYHRNNELIVHERTHTGEKPYICEVCGSGYASSKYLKRHLFTHTGLKPYKCDLCERAFARPENMRAHRKLHEKPSNRLPPATTESLPAFRVNHVDTTLPSDSVPGLSSSPDPVADGYQFPPATLPQPLPTNATSVNDRTSDSLMQAFKISDDL